jgi:hypothetical protein
MGRDPAGRWTQSSSRDFKIARSIWMAALMAIEMKIVITTIGQSDRRFQRWRHRARDRYDMSSLVSRRG